MTKPKRKHTDDSLPGCSADDSVHIANAVAATLAALLAEMPHVDRDALAFEVAAVAWRYAEGKS
jgi:hypothetical protein